MEKFLKKINNKIIYLINRLFKKYFDKKIFMIGCSHILNIRQSYNNINKLNDLDYKVFSQNGEDGIIDYLLSRLNIAKPKFVEIGVGDYSESNTRFFFERTSCKGMIIDCLQNLKAQVSKNIKLWKGDLTIVEGFINSQNIREILNKNGFDNNLDLFSLDIDGIDYWILKSLPENFSKIAVIEYNSVFGPNLEISVPNIKEFNRTAYHYSNLCWGASLKALVKLMESKNFVFVGTNYVRCNAFFVLKNYLDNIRTILPEKHNFELHTDSNIRESRDKYGKLNYVSGKDRLKLIENCEVVNLSNSESKILKIKDI
jgi:hypothetical protein|tara:strand:- start:1058 stop:1999 length:942 start_codon:yes stop_codon:yes gene_type:complete